MANKKKEFAVIILAAGKGVRMKSSLPKVLHKLDGKPMIQRTAEILSEVNPRQIIIVINLESINKIRQVVPKKCTFAIQKSPLGTADATIPGLRKVEDDVRTVAVMYGDDTAFYEPGTVLEVFKKHQDSEAKITLVTVQKKHPSGLGRI